MPINTCKYIENFIKIRNKNSDIVPLHLNKAQERLYDVIRLQKQQNKPVRVIILKARQLGFSTVTGGFIMKETATHPNKQAAIVAHQEDSTTNLFNMYKLMYQNLPTPLKPTQLASNAKELVFDNKTHTGLNSRIRCMTAGTGGVGRSFTINYLHISELAFWKSDVKNTLLGLMQAVPNNPDSMIIIESTANGYEEFQERWEAAVKGESDFYPLFVGWNELDEYSMPYTHFELTEEEHDLQDTYSLSLDQLEWRRWCIKNNCGGDTRLFKQEYPICVVGDSRVGTDKGLLPIKDLKEGYTTKYGEIIRHIKNPVSKIYKLTTSDGYSLRGTYEHPIFLTTGEIKDLGSLLKGDKIELSIPKTATDYYTIRWCDLGVEKSIKITEQWGKFLGYFMGDGSFSNNCLSVVCDAKDLDTIEDVKMLIKNIFGLEAHTRLVGSNEGGCEVRVNCKGLTEIFDKLDIIERRKSDEHIIRKVHVPDCIFKSPLSVIKEFLRALFECDGYNDDKVPRIVFFSKHKKFIDDIQLLLLSCGVVSKNISRKTHNSEGYNYIANELILRGMRAIEYQNKIGFISKRKIEKYNYPKNMKRTTKNQLETEVVDIIEDGFEKVFNLTIKNIHEFDANGIHTHNCPEEAFLTTGDCVFDQEKIMSRLQSIPNPLYKGYFTYNYDDTKERQNKIQDIEFTQTNTSNGYISIYKEPISDHSYTLCGDTAGDTQGDYFAAHVIDNLTCEEVAVYHNMTDETLFARQMICLGYRYNTALIAIEANFSTYPNKEISRLGYPNIYVRDKEDDFRQPVISAYGFKTTQITRPLIISSLVDIIRDNVECINDRLTLNECLTFITNEHGRKEAMQGKHDDLVMSLGIGYYVRNQRYFKVVYSEPTLKKLFKWSEDLKQDYYKADAETRKRMEEKYGQLN